MTARNAAITVRDLTVAYGPRIIQKDLSFTIQERDIFIIMGGSGCGKSSLLRVLMGLTPPAKGSVFYGSTDFWGISPAERNALMRKTGVMFQSGALWTSRTLAENVALPLEYYTTLPPSDIRDLARLKLALVGLAGFEDFYPSEISGGMKKRAGLARAIALDPQIVYFDEPSAGLDPVSAARLDELILQLRDTLAMTIVVVTHELDSIFTISNNSVFLDAQTKTMAACGDPHKLLTSGPDNVIEFLTRGKSRHGGKK